MRLLAKILIVLSLFTLSCTSITEIEYEDFLVKDLSKYEKIQIGWLDLNEDDWYTHGFQSKDEWKKVIEDINQALHVKFKIYLACKEIHFDNSTSKGAPKSASLHIRFKHSKVIRTSRSDDIHTTIQFLENNKIIYSTKGIFRGKWEGWNFESNLMFPARRIAIFISEKFKC